MEEENLSLNGSDYRRAMWANAPKAAKAWAHNRRTKKGDWRGMSRTSKLKKR